MKITDFIIRVSTIAATTALLVAFLLIAITGKYGVEPNKWILYFEITLTAIIMILGTMNLIKDWRDKGDLV